jgi:predicted flap endonuclease-1-like 5' DNA nuclease
MESKQKPIPIVKSPSRNSYLREGKGFSLEEIKKAGKSIQLLKTQNIKIDYFRKSSHKENIEKLKSIEEPKKKGKKREPFEKKEKKRTPYKPKTEKPKRKRVPKPKVVAKKPKEKEKPKAIKKEKGIIKKEVSVEKLGTPLTELPGLGPATSNKFAELGVNNVEDLCKEKPEELALLIKGVSEERLRDWIEQGKKMIEQ